jgi:hypothetical protein
MRLAMADDAAARMTEAASAWLDALSPDQRAKASFPFVDEAERTSWAYFPRNHKGLPLLEQDVRQQKLAHALISCSLSLPAYAKVNTIVGLESTLNEIEQRRADQLRDPGRYFVSVFGAPGKDAWSWRLEGHHVSLNFTFADGEVISPTPIFLGANPAVVRHGEHAVIRPCAEEEDAARELLLSLDADQRGAAVICDTAPPDFVMSNAPRVPETCSPGDLAPRLLAPLFGSMTDEQRTALAFDLAQPRGVSASALDGGQRKLLSELVDCYTGRLPEPLAQRERAKIDVASVHFAWAGEDKPRRPHYYRLQGPSFLVEYDNTQDGANHVHAVWRNPANDFAYDALRAHVREAH